MGRPTELEMIEGLREKLGRLDEGVFNLLQDLDDDQEITRGFAESMRQLISNYQFTLYMYQAKVKKLQEEESD